MEDISQRILRGGRGKGMTPLECRKDPESGIGVNVPLEYGEDPEEGWRYIPLKG